jgi:hypothetical protein
MERREIFQGHDLRFAQHCVAPYPPSRHLRIWGVARYHAIGLCIHALDLVVSGECEPHLEAFQFAHSAALPGRLEIGLRDSSFKVCHSEESCIFELWHKIAGIKSSEKVEYAQEREKKEVST